MHPTDRREPQNAERVCGVFVDRERDMAEEAVPDVRDEPNAIALGVATKLELRRVMEHKHGTVLFAPLDCRGDMRLQDELLRYTIVAEEPVERFRSCLVAKGHRESGARLRGHRGNDCFQPLT